MYDSAQQRRQQTNPTNPPHGGAVEIGSYRVESRSEAMKAVAVDVANLAIGDVDPCIDNDTVRHERRCPNRCAVRHGRSGGGKSPRDAAADGRLPDRAP